MRFTCLLRLLLLRGLELLNEIRLEVDFLFAVFPVFGIDFVGDSCENCVVDGQSLDGVQIFDELQAERAPDSLVLVEIIEAGGAEGVAAVDQDSRNPIFEIKVLLAEHAVLQVDQLAHKLLDFLLVLGGGIVRLLKEVGRRILDSLHHFRFGSSACSML